MLGATAGRDNRRWQSPDGFQIFSHPQRIAALTRHAQISVFIPRKAR
jgi:hypothetical protein